VEWAITSLRDVRLDQMAQLADGTGAVFASMGVMSTYTLLSGVISFLIARSISAGGGGGIPDIKAYLNGNLLPDFLSWSTLIVRLIGVSLVASSGVMAGPEGPMSHVGMILTVLIPSLIFSSQGVNDRDNSI